MTAHQSFSTAELHSSEADGVRAAWRRHGAEPAIMFVENPGSDEPAKRWPDTPVPSVDPGHVAFEPGAYPSLTTARSLLPEYSRLWDAVADDFVEVLRPARTPDCAAEQHSAFFALPA